MLYCICGAVHHVYSALTFDGAPDSVATTHLNNEAYTTLALIGPVMYGSALTFGFMLWRLGTWWMFHAVVTVSTHCMTHHLTFNVGIIYFLALCSCSDTLASLMCLADRNMGCHLFTWQFGTPQSCK
jgi:hypothetical protein